MPGRAFTYASGWCVERGGTLGHSPEGLATAREVVRKVIAATPRCAWAGDAGSPTRTKASAKVAHRRSFHSAGLAARRSCSTCDAAAFAPGTANRS
jgi:hypothetical protein